MLVDTRLRSKGSVFTEVVTSRRGNESEVYYCEAASVVIDVGSHRRSVKLKPGHVLRLPTNGRHSRVAGTPVFHAVALSGG